MKSTFFSLLILLLVVSACSTEKKATKAFLLGKYQNAIELYKKTGNSPKANFFIAESYRLSNRLKEAEQYYSRAGGRGIDKDTIKFYYAQSLKANTKYEDAKKQYEELIASSSNEALKDRAKTEMNGLAYLAKLNETTSYYKVKNLEDINTPASEYSPVYLSNELYFTSSRGDGKIYEAEGKPFTDLYKVATKGANVDLNTIAKLPEGINDNIRNEGCVTFSPDGKTMVFAKGNSEKKKGGGADVDLYISRFRNNVWSEPIPININTQFKNESDPDAKNYSWDSTPAFSQDGRTLYFASNRKGGYGGTDLYSAQMDSRGRFTRVRNLGPEINTPGDELFPYIAEDAKLYFASDAHPGYGGLDLFVVKRANGKTQIENLGQPMNSSDDDFGIFLFKPDRGFFASNRSGGKGDDDIYTFVNEDPNLKVVNYYLQGVAYTEDKDQNRQILPNAKVSLLDAKGDLMQDYTTGNDGKFLFRVYENEDYNLVGETDGYLIKRQNYTMKGKSVDPNSLKELITTITLDTLIVLDRIELNKIFVLDNIYYNYNKSDIRPDAAKELDKLVQLLVDNPEIKIELGSHTDSVDTDDYNQRLSQRRAESAVAYIVQHGIAPDRLVAKGYGESKPIARNTNPDGTDNPVGRQKNRRTEFKILEVSSRTKPIQDEEVDEEDKYFRDN
ncbi:OmpA family protein [Ohtaekwangia koreensis]|uniref:Outer membrane protein OmpA n=1 Tax=Ohtaekwangia koreensis TaxID=688867 RepID=A0A1T5LG26_9BACT|nr:OmpA family protein [Ohtaekwangia koreensis]SKC74996.1 Outer membrane protein OmpA [Ohtaekwangia koreensis]